MLNLPLNKLKVIALEALRAINIRGIKGYKSMSKDY